MKQTHGLNVPEKLEELCHPRTMALLIYDMQVGIRSQIKGGDEIVARVSRALTAARKAGMRVVYTRHVSMPKSWMGVTQYRTAMAWQRKEERTRSRPGSCAMRRPGNHTRGARRCLRRWQSGGRGGGARKHAIHRRGHHQ